MEAPAYCMICDRAISTGPVCDGCAEWPDDDDDNYDEGGEDAHLEAAYEDRFAFEDYHQED